MEKMQQIFDALQKGIQLSVQAGVQLRSTWLTPCALSYVVIRFT